jgi:hypothetical protein
MGVAHGTGMRDEKGYKVLVGRHKGKRPLGSSEDRWEVVNWILLLICLIINFFPLILSNIMQSIKIFLNGLSISL